MKKYIYILIALLCSTPAFSAPSISSVSDAIEHNESITISGSDFEPSATDDTPSVWDNLEDGSCNTTATVGTWSSVNVLSISSNNDRHSNSNYCGHHNFQGEATGAFRCNGTPISRAWFVQYWVYLATNWEWGDSVYGGGSQFLSNVKWIRYWNPGSTNENFYVAFGTSLSSNSRSIDENISGTKDYFDVQFAKEDMPLGSWQCFQFEFLDSSSNDVADAEFRVWRNGTLIETRINFVARESSNYKRPYFIGYYNSWSGGNGHDNDFYIDDVYVDTTWARVEIGNNSTYGSCTHREIQIPTNWTSSSISVTVNQGSFADEATAYLFVVDADGDVSSGYEIEIGGEDTSSPELNTSVISANGTTLTLTFNEAVTQGSGYNDNQWDLDCSLEGNGIGITYVSGDEGTAHVYTIASTIGSTDTCNIDFDGTADSMEDDNENDLEAIVSDSVTNNSTEDLIAPELSTSVISANGTTLTLTFDENVNQGGGYADADWDLDCSVTGNGIGLTYDSGDGTDEHIYIIDSTIQDEVCNIDFNGDANSMEDDSGNDLAAIVSDPVTNNSEQGPTPPELNTTVIATNGTTTTLTFNENISQGSGYNDADLNMDCTTTGNDIPMTYVSGDGTDEHIYTLGSEVQNAGADTCNLDFNGDANSLENDDGVDLEAITNGEVTNNSEMPTPPKLTATGGTATGGTIN